MGCCQLDAPPLRPESNAQALKAVPSRPQGNCHASGPNKSPGAATVDNSLWRELLYKALGMASATMIRLSLARVATGGRAKILASHQNLD